MLPELLSLEHMDFNKIFNREIFVYKKLLPTLYKLQEDYGLKEEDRFSIPKFYKGSSKETDIFIIMEDLSIQGFKMLDRCKSFDYAHVEMSIKTIARFHASSIVLKDKNPTFYQTVRSFMSFESDFGTGFRSMAHRSKVNVQHLIKEEPYYDKVMEFYDYVYENIKENIDTNAADPYSVLCHGDCWCNNLMFKYEVGILSHYKFNFADKHIFVYLFQDNKVVDIRMIDWQIMREGSPIMDIGYFMFLCTGRDLKEKHYHHFLNVYYKTLSSNVTKMGVDIEKYYPEHVYRSQLKNLLKTSLIMVFIAMSYMYADGRNSPIFKYSELAKTRLKELIEDCIKYGNL